MIKIALLVGALLILIVVAVRVIRYLAWRRSCTFEFSFQIDDNDQRASFVDVAAGIEMGNARRRPGSREIDVYRTGLPDPCLAYSWDDAWQRLSDPMSLPGDPVRFVRPLGNETANVVMDPYLRREFIKEAGSKNRLRLI